MKKLNIALLAGGNSSEREVALASAAMILDAFDRSRYNVIPVDVHGLHWTCKGAGDRKVEVDKTDFSVPVGDGKRLAEVYRTAEVLERRDDGERIYLRVRC